VRARVGVVGAGWWSTRVHLPSLFEYDRAELVGVADVDLQRATRAADAFGCRAFATLTELIECGVDAVIVATTHGSHYSLTKEAIVAGADVLVEKPAIPTLTPSTPAAPGRSSPRAASARSSWW
jgi:predicted dehydrogenase